VIRFALFNFFVRVPFTYTPEGNKLFSGIHPRFSSKPPLRDQRFSWNSIFAILCNQPRYPYYVVLSVITASFLCLIFKCAIQESLPLVMFSALR